MSHEDDLYAPRWVTDEDVVFVAGPATGFHGDRVLVRWQVERASGALGAHPEPSAA